jgi:hypothetical protein
MHDTSYYLLLRALVCALCFDTSYYLLLRALVCALCEAGFAACSTIVLEAAVYAAVATAAATTAATTAAVVLLALNVFRMPTNYSPNFRIYVFAALAHLVCLFFVKLVAGAAAWTVVWQERPHTRVNLQHLEHKGSWRLSYYRRTLLFLIGSNQQLARSSSE